MVITRDGKEIVLTDAEVNSVYSAVCLENDLDCARIYLREHAEDVSVNKDTPFEVLYGFAVEDACNPESEHYVLQKIVDLFNNEYSVDLPERELWLEAVEGVLKEISADETEGVYEITYYEHLAYTFFVPGKSREEAKRNFDAKCGRGEVAFTDPRIEDSGIRSIEKMLKN